MKAGAPTIDVAAAVAAASIAIERIVGDTSPPHPVAGPDDDESRGVVPLILNASVSTTSP